VQLVEIRDLDGPNVFLLEPAIKVEFVLDDADRSPSSRQVLSARLSAITQTDPTSALADQISTAIGTIYNRHHLTPPATVWVELETPGHGAIAFGWSNRRFALGAANVIAEAACGEVAVDSSRIDALADFLAHPKADDTPFMVRNADLRMPIVSITGTNGKTTTTRLIAHILRQSGKRVGWSSSSGVFIEGKEVMEGDYTGPSGALRVLHDPDVDVAVLETARGGILLRGIAYESNDVSVITNVSGDHLDLQGVRTVEGLADAKSTVIRITKPGGFAVLNADDPLVVAQSSKSRARIFYVTQQAKNNTVASHIESGGNALSADDGRVDYWHDGIRNSLTSIDEIPIAFGGSARHMLENALCGAAACLGLGLRPETVRDGLATFSSTPSDNLGRLNLYEVEGATVVVDFAHNEAGLRHLLDLARGLAAQGSNLFAIIGTAGDRTDANLQAIGRIAAESADFVFVKETVKYLRGRASNEELNELYIAGIKRGGKTDWKISSSELEALKLALGQAMAGDVVAMMCVEQVQEVHDYLHAVGKPSPMGQPRAS
jgi:cyanophycin synthetase